MHTLLDVLRALVEHAHFPVDEMKDQAHGVLNQLEQDGVTDAESMLHPAPTAPGTSVPAQNPEA